MLGQLARSRAWQRCAATSRLVAVRLSSSVHVTGSAAKRSIGSGEAFSSVRRQDWAAPGGRAHRAAQFAVRAALGGVLTCLGSRALQAGGVLDGGRNVAITCLIGPQKDDPAQLAGEQPGVGSVQSLGGGETGSVP
ncbi:hypothetical protein ACIPSE_45865 [Streptomyces sp. NPDC090106]|uniref:hypothetical protein n=1 Tax=Streptomyces sp. NPDC090106 TaxID=3365946 RepID=UPI00380852C3